MLRNNAFHRELNFYFSLPISSKTFFRSELTMILIAASLQYMTVASILWYRYAEVMSVMQILAILLFYISFSLIMISFFVYITYLFPNLYSWGFLLLEILLSILIVVIQQTLKIGWILHWVYQISLTKPIYVSISFLPVSIGIFFLITRYIISNIKRVRIV